MNDSFHTNVDLPERYFSWNFDTITALIISIAVPLAVGALSAYFTWDEMMIFDTMNKPALAPPAWLFPIAWTILYALMGIASFVIFYSTDGARYYGLILYVVQLIVNFAWSLIFFKLGAYVPAAMWLGILIILIAALIMNTAKYSILAMVLLLPYFMWCCFALYLNIGIAMKNSMP